MRRVLLPSLLALGLGTAHADSSIDRPKPGKCVEPAAAWADEKRVDKESDEALDRELAALHFERIKPVVDLVREEGNYLAPPGGNSRVLPPWKVATDAQGRAVLPEPSYVDDCGPDRSPPRPILARAADGRIVRVKAQPRAGRHRTVTICGCGPQTVNRCGLNMQWRVQRRWVVPPNSRYAGEIEVAYDAAILDKRYTVREGDCPPPLQPP